MGVDVSEAMLARACCPGNVRLQHIDMTRHFLGETFDVVTAFRFFLNAEPLLREQALQAIRNHLTEGGTARLQRPNECHLANWDRLAYRELVSPVKTAQYNEH